MVRALGVEDEERRDVAGAGYGVAAEIDLAANCLRPFPVSWPALSWRVASNLAGRVMPSMPADNALARIALPSST